MHFNPCLLGRHPRLEGLGDALAALFVDWFEEPTGGCPCCIAVRILLVAAASAAAGLVIGALL